MPQPAEVTAIPDELASMFHAAQADIETQLTGFTTERRAARLRELQRTVNTLLDELERQTRTWIEQSLPGAYAFGAGDAAAVIGDDFVWTQPHVEALNALARTTWDDMLASTRFVRRDTKDWIRSEARQQSTLALLEGRTARQAGRALADAAGNELDLFAVTYKNGARVRLADYADMALRTTTANAYAEGTINQSRQSGVQAMECADGAECGLFGHDDGEKPNGRVYSIDVAAGAQLSHPRCRRSWIPRIDVSAKEIDTAPSLRTEAQRADQAASEIARSGRTPRTPRSADARVRNTIRRRGLRNTSAAPIVDRVGTAIDKVHEIPGGMRRIPVSIDPTLPKNTAAQFARIGTEPVSIVINPAGRTPDIAYTHEYGHYLDFEALGGKGAFASQTLTADGELLHDWSQAVESSKGLAALTARFGHDPVYLEYARRPRELFARSYAQWVATRSADTVLLQQLKTWQKVQWSATDFEPIGQALDELFASLGLLK